MQTACFIVGRSGKKSVLLKLGTWRIQKFESHSFILVSSSEIKIPEIGCL